MRTRDLPAVWTLNQVHLEAPTTTDDAIHLADEHQADLPYRYVVVDDEPSGRRLADELGARGWASDRLLVMELAYLSLQAQAGHRSPIEHAVVAIDHAQALDLTRGWALEANPDITPAELEQVVEYHHREGELWNERSYGCIGRDGTPANMVKLRSDGAVAWVEDVYTRPEERRRGLARAVLEFVVGLARLEEHSLVFLLADDDDWPKGLYAQIGFAPVGLRWSFRLPVSA